MTHIKCRYSIPYCDITKVRKHGDYEVCSSDFFCDEGHYEDKREGNVIYTVCKHLKYRSGEFEKDVKSYSYDGDLKIRGMSLDAYDIDYLEIDGRVVSDLEAEEE